MKGLRAYLGNHHGMRPGQLTERETAMLVISAGRKAGFIVRTEVSVRAVGRTGKPVRGEIDVGWYNSHTNALLVAWEIDGRDAGEPHFLGNLKKGTVGNKAKFDACSAALRFQVLYSVKNDLALKGQSKQMLIERLLGTSAIVVTDEDLAADPGIDHWTTEAQRLICAGDRTTS